MKMQMNADILRKIRNLEIKTRKLLQGYYIGEHRASQKGYGLEFEQLAEYQYGHDVRFIDWKSSARMNKLLVREYKDERTRTIIIAFDISASTFFGVNKSKSEVMLDIASILIIAGLYGKDMVGLMLFSDTVEAYIPPAKTRQHMELLLRTLCEIADPGTNARFSGDKTKQQEKKTSIKSALEYIARLRRRDAMVFILSDMIDEGYEKALKMVAMHSDCIVLRTLDRLENTFPSIGFVEVIDSEGNQKVLLNIQGAMAARSGYFLQNYHEQQTKIIKSCGADIVDIENTEKVVEQLMRFFQARTR